MTSLGSQGATQLARGELKCLRPLPQPRPPHLASALPRQGPPHVSQRPQLRPRLPPLSLLRLDQSSLDSRSSWNSWTTPRATPSSLYPISTREPWWVMYTPLWALLGWLCWWSDPTTPTPKTESIKFRITPMGHACRGFPCAWNWKLDHEYKRY